MRKIDIHPHIISSDEEKFPRAPLQGKQSKWSKDHTVGYEEMLREMDKNGVEKSVLVQSSTCYGFDNSYVATAIAAHPDRLSGVCSIDALAADAPDTLNRMAEQGFIGVRLFVSGATITNVDSWFNDERCFPFWEQADRLGMPVCLQTSWATIAQVKETLERFPKVKVVLDHMMRPPIESGAPYEGAQPLFDLSANKNLFLKLTPVNFKDARQGQATPESFLDKVISVFGAGQIAWGSNFPSSTPTLGEAFDAFEAVSGGLSDTDKAKILGGTALRIYSSLA